MKQSVTLLTELLGVSWKNQYSGFYILSPCYIGYLLLGTWILVWESLMSPSNKCAKLDLFLDCSTRPAQPSHPRLHKHRAWFSCAGPWALLQAQLWLNWNTFVASAGLKLPSPWSLVKQKQKCAFTFWLKLRLKFYKPLMTTFSVISWIKHDKLQITGYLNIGKL